MHESHSSDETSPVPKRCEPLYLSLQYRVPSLNAMLKGKIVKKLIIEKQRAKAALESALRVSDANRSIPTTPSASPSSTPCATMGLSETILPTTSNSPSPSARSPIDTRKEPK